MKQLDLVQKQNESLELSQSELEKQLTENTEELEKSRVQAAKLQQDLAETTEILQQQLNKATENLSRDFAAKQKTWAEERKRLDDGLQDLTNQKFEARVRRRLAGWRRLGSIRGATRQVRRRQARPAQQADQEVFQEKAGCWRVCSRLLVGHEGQARGHRQVPGRENLGNYEEYDRRAELARRPGHGDYEEARLQQNGRGRDRRQDLAVRAD